MSAENFRHPLYPMDTGFYNSLGNYTLESRCAMAAELGFADAYLTLWSPEAWEDLKQLKAVPAKHGLGVAAVYQTVNIDRLRDPALLKKIDEIFENLPQDAVLELAVNLAKDSPRAKSDEAATTSSCLSSDKSCTGPIAAGTASVCIRISTSG